MAALCFTTTRLSGLRVAGRLQELQHATVAPLLERELGPDYGRLFADFEPESSDVRAWYTDAGKPPRALATLSEAQAEALRQRVADMIGHIGDFAARIAGESTQKANLARILTAASTFPMEDIWADGEQPIIVNWGFHRHDVEAGVPIPIRDRIRRRRAVRPGSIGSGIEALEASGVGLASSLETATAGAAGSTSAAAGIPVTDIFIHGQGPTHQVVIHQAAPARRAGDVLPALLWLVFCLFAVACYGLLLPACGLAGLARLGTCPLSAADTQVFSEGAELQALVEGAELEATRRDALCRAPRRADLRRPDPHRSDPRRGAASLAFATQ